MKVDWYIQYVYTDSNKLHNIAKHTYFATAWRGGTLGANGSANSILVDPSNPIFMIFPIFVNFRAFFQVFQNTFLIEFLRALFPAKNGQL